MISSLWLKYESVHDYSVSIVNREIKDVATVGEKVAAKLCFANFSFR